MSSVGKASLAEFIGTFTLVFIGAGAGAIATAGSAGLVSVALAHGFALATIVYAWGPISGANVNPAVTFGLLVARKIDIARAAFYWAAQLLGGLAAAAVLHWLLVGYMVDEKQVGLGETTGTLTKDFPCKTMVVEGILTFFLVVAVFGSAVSGRNGNAFGMAIGLILTMDILMGGPLTGASMNPARTLGPAVVAGNTGYVWMYFVGPLIGGGIAGLLYNCLYIDKAKT